MINGKFFSGLPPGMMKRGGGGDGGKNRLESHLFWPDDSQAIPATEMRLKRNNSMQHRDRLEASPPAARQAEQQQHDVNTKRMFHREFAKSSIQFCDNVEEQPQPAGRQPGLRSQQAKQQLALKISEAAPLKLLADDAVDGADSPYMKAKKQQAFVSRIEFNDYAEDDLNTTNNHRPRLDKNDKRQLERNAKNIPKLQSKSKVNNLEVISGMPDTKVMNDYGKFVTGRGEEQMLTNFERIGNNKQRINCVVGEVDNVDHVKSRKFHTNTDDERQYPEHFLNQTNSSDHGTELDVNYIQNNMKTLWLHAEEEGPKKKQLCGRNNSEFEDCHSDNNFGRYYGKSNDTRLTRQRSGPDAGSNLRHSQNRRHEPSYEYDAIAKANVYEPYMETPALKATAAPTFKTHNNRLYQSANTRNNGRNDNDDYTPDNIQGQKPSGYISTVSRPEKSEVPDWQAMDAESVATQLRRSSNASKAAMEDADGGPSSISSYRRTARNSATQRVSVGLPN